MRHVLSFPGRCARHLIRDRSATAALEFAFTGVAFLGLTLFVISLGFRLYVQVALDYASSRAARLLAVDSSQALSRTLNSFQANTFCPVLSAFLSCVNVTISLVGVSDYSNGSSIGPGPPPFNPGGSRSLMLLQVTYQLPNLSWPISSGTGSGGFAVASVSASYPYQNEY